MFSMKVLNALILGKGPKYFEPSWIILRVLNTRGNFSLVIRNAGYDLSSFRLILYRGECCFMRVFSRMRASYSFDVVIYSMENALETRVLVLTSLTPEKYEVRRFLRFFAFPT